MTATLPLNRFKCHAKIPESVTRNDPTAVRPSITDVCLICPHIFGDHNIYCSQCTDSQHEFMVECGGALKAVNLSREKWRTTKCIKCRHVWMVIEG